MSTGPQPDTTDRNQQIIDAYQSGQTVTSLASEHGVSRQRVNQIVRPHAPHRKPEMALTKRNAAAIK